MSKCYAVVIEVCLELNLECCYFEQILTVYLSYKIATRWQLGASVKYLECITVIGKKGLSQTDSIFIHDYTVSLTKKNCTFLPLFQFGISLFVHITILPKYLIMKQDEQN